jgi:hypothetical protein
MHNGGIRIALCLWLYSICHSSDLGSLYFNMWHDHLQYIHIV